MVPVFSRMPVDFVGFSIGTHDGKGHPDDVFGCAELLLLCPQAIIIRTRDPLELAKCTYRVDTGGLTGSFDFDHHQKGGAGQRAYGLNIPYQAAGLVWRQFGFNICAGNLEATLAVDERLIQQIDAHDAGISLFTPVVPGMAPSTIGLFLSSLMPNWDENFSMDEAFAQAVEIAILVLKREIAKNVSRIAAEKIVEVGIEQAKTIDPRMIELSKGCPWQEYLCDQSQEALYVIYPIGQEYRVQCVPTEPNGRNSRKAFPDSWKDQKGADLVSASGVTGAIFCSPAGHICGAATAQAAWQMAALAADWDNLWR